MESVAVPVVASVVWLHGPVWLSKVRSSSVATQPCWQGVVSRSLGADCSGGVSQFGCPELLGVTKGRELGLSPVFFSGQSGVWTDVLEKCLFQDSERHLEELYELVIAFLVVLGGPRVHTLAKRATEEQLGLFRL